MEEEVCFFHFKVKKTCLCVNFSPTGEKLTFSGLFHLEVKKTHFGKNSKESPINDMNAAPIYCKEMDPTNASLWVIHINVPEFGNVKVSFQVDQNIVMRMLSGRPLSFFIEESQ